MDGNKTVKKGVPIREGLFVSPSEPGEKPYLIGSRCKKCGRMAFPPRRVCSQCLEVDLEQVPLSRKGTLYSFSIVRYSPPGLEAPYAVGYVDLPEGVRVFSILMDWEDDRLKVGMDLEMVIEPLKEDEAGNPILTYKFRPIH